MLRAAQREKATRALMPPQQLDPAARNDGAHGKSQQVNGLLRSKARLDRVIKVLRQGQQRSGAKAMGQMGRKDLAGSGLETLLQPPKHMGRVPQPMH